tara:strand:- start:77 stop:853 length:777 start_codon:yes stop_codon:yes gene_type:complete
MFITKVSFLFFIIFESIKPQNMNESTLLSDFGVVIQKSNKSHLKNLNGLSSSAPKINAMNKKSVYISSSSELIGSIDRINEKMRLIEQTLKSEIESLERDNKTLKNRVIKLNDKLSEQEISKIDINKILQQPQDSNNPFTEDNQKAKPPSEDISIIDDEFFSKKIMIKGFDEEKYTSGVIAYQLGDFNQCIKMLSILPIDETNNRTAKNILFMLADSYREINKYTHSRKTFYKLLKKYPESEYTDISNKHLSKLAASK